MICPKVLLWAVLSAVAVTSRAEENAEVPIIKQINRVNEDGTYTFGYEAADGSFKIETRDVLGNVKGMFGFIDETGELKRVSYTASNGTGFQATGNIGQAGNRERRPILVLRHPTTTTTRAPVIQHIPPRRATTVRAESNTTPVYSEYGRKETATTTAATTTTEEAVTRPVRILVTKRPVVEEAKPVNLIRRQLAAERPDPFAPRRVYLDPRDVYRNMLLEQNDLKPEVPRYYLAEEPEVPAVVPMVERVLRARLPPVVPRYRVPVEPLPYRPALARLPQRVYDDYDQPLDLEALRDEIMNYLIQYLQLRARRINPYYTPYLDQPRQYYPVVARPQVPLPLAAPPPPYYPRNLPITPSPNIQYSDRGQQVVLRMRQPEEAEARPSPLIRMLLAAPQQRPPAVRSVEILGTAASTTTATPIAPTTTETPDEMQASS